MIFNAKAETHDFVTDAAAALVACWQSGIIAVAPACCQYQRERIESEMRVAGQLLAGDMPAEDARTYALDAVTNIRHGLQTGALIVARDGAEPHVQATLAKAGGGDTRCPCVWFDAPADVRSVSG